MLPPKRPWKIVWKNQDQEKQVLEANGKEIPGRPRVESNEIPVELRARVFRRLTGLVFAKDIYEYPK